MKRLADIFRWRAAIQPQEAALICDDKQTTYAELDQRASQLAQGLIAAGIKPGDRVCVLDKNHQAYLEVMIGAAKAGAVYTPINWRLVPPEIAFILNDVQCPLLFVGEEFRDSIESVKETLTVQPTVVCWGKRDDNQSSLDYQTFVSSNETLDPHLDGGDDDSVWQLYTSGTTGNPKGAEISHNNLYAYLAANVVNTGGICMGDTALSCLPLFHVGGSAYALLMLYAGCRLVLIDAPDCGHILKLIEAWQVQDTFLVPALIAMLMQHPDFDKTDLSSLRNITYGASPIPEPVLLDCMAKLDCNLIQLFGSTESVGAITSLPAAEHYVGNPRLKSCGRAHPLAEIRVVDDKGEDCEPGQSGEIIYRGDQVMKGYYKRPEANADSFKEGWFYSGDAGYLDEEGFLYIQDRIKDLIISGGENIYPAEVESVLHEHPAVLEAAVIGVPDDTWGESVKAIIVPGNEAPIDFDGLLAYCRQQLAGYKCPKSFDMIDALPRNPSGKILKRELRKPYWQGKGRSVN